MQLHILDKGWKTLIIQSNRNKCPSCFEKVYRSKNIVTLDVLVQVIDICDFACDSAYYIVGGAEIVTQRRRDDVEHLILSSLAGMANE